MRSSSKTTTSASTQTRRFRSVAAERTGDAVALARRSALVFACALLAVVALPDRAYAEGTARQRALELNQEGKALVADGRFVDGAGKFREAYQTYPEPALLLKESIAWFKAGRCDDAVPVAQAFLDQPAAMSADDKAQARLITVTCAVHEARTAYDDDRLDEASAHLDRAEKLGPDEESGKEIANLRELIARRHAATDAAPDTSEPVPPATAAPKRSGNGRRILGWSLLGAGAISGAASLAMWAPLAADIREHNRCNDVMPQDDLFPGDAVCNATYAADLEGKRSKRQPLIFATAGLGAALGAVGIIALLWPDESSTVSVSPSGDGWQVAFSVPF